MPGSIVIRRLAPGLLPPAHAEAAVPAQNQTREDIDTVLRGLSGNLVPHPLNLFKFFPVDIRRRHAVYSVVMAIVNRAF